MAIECMAYRIDWDGKGPFYLDQYFNSLLLACRKVTPNWSKCDVTWSSWVEHYCYTAPSPHDHPVVSNYISSPRPIRLKFAFASLDSLRSLLGLADQEIYLTQFNELLKSGRLTLKALIVNAVCWTDDEVLYKEEDFTFIESVTSV